jgi:hypothetical protein
MKIPTQRQRTKTSSTASMALFVWIAMSSLLPAGSLARHYQDSRAVDAHAMQRALREIDDPKTGTRWLLVRDERRPAGPGRLIQAATREGHSGGQSGGLAAETVSSAKILAPLPVVIRSGDRLVVEEHSSVIAMQLEAVALGPATEGKTLDARLKVGGKVVRVVALGAGRARLAAYNEDRP